MAQRPPHRPPARASLGDLSIGGADPEAATERHLDALKEAVGRVSQAAVTPTVNRLSFNPLSPVPTTESTVYLNPADGELYYVDPDGDVSQLSNQSSGGGGGDTYSDREFMISMIDVSVPLGSVGAPGDGFTSITTTANNTQLVFGPIGYRMGERLKACSVRVVKNSLGTMTLRFQKSVDGGGRADIGASATSSTNGGPQTLTSTVTTPTAPVAGENFYVTLTCPNSGDQFLWGSYTVDKVA